MESFSNFLSQVIDEDVDRDQYLGNVSDLPSPCTALLFAFVPSITTQSRSGCFLQSSGTLLFLIISEIAAVLCSWNPFTHVLLDIAIEFSGPLGFPSQKSSYTLIINCIYEFAQLFYVNIDVILPEMKFKLARLSESLVDLYVCEMEFLGKDQSFSRVTVMTVCKTREKA